MEEQEKTKARVVYTTLSPDEHYAAKQLARSEGRTLASLLRGLVRQRLARRARGRP